MITKLTEEQEKQLVLFREGQRVLGARTGHDSECERIGNEAIADAYRESNLTPPKTVVWAKSPMGALKLACDLGLMDKTKPRNEQLKEAWQNWWFFGQCEGYWLAWHRFAINIGVKVTEEQERRLALLERLARACYLVFSWADVSILVEHPSVAKFDAQYRLHCTDGPALAWPDGYALYSVNGVRLAVDLGRSMADDTLTAKEISEVNNAEARRVLVTTYNKGDTGRYLRDLGATVIHADTDPLGLPRRLLRIEQPGDEPIVAIEVTNSTPEPDGTRKVYTFRCDPELRPLAVPGMRKEPGSPQTMTCANAIASTYGMTGEEYRLSVET